MFTVMLVALGWALVLLLVSAALWVLTFSAQHLGRLRSWRKTEAYVDRLRKHQLSQLEAQPNRADAGSNVIHHPFGGGAA